MFTWGGNWLKDKGEKSWSPGMQQGVWPWEPGYRIRDLQGGCSNICFLKANGNAFIVRIQSDRAPGKRKFVKWKEKFQAVSCGDDEAALLTETGSLICVDLTHTPLTPRPLRGLSGAVVSQVSCGSRHSLALTRDGRLFSWGLDSRGQLGLGGSGSRSDSARLVRSVSAIPLARIAAGGEQSFAVSVSGNVLAWGRNDRGQLGLGDTADRNTPTSLRSLNMKKTMDVACGDDHTAVLTRDGVVFTFGSGGHGQLGHNSLRDEFRPRLVAELFGARVVRVACGSHHTVVLTHSGRLFWCGRGAEHLPAVPLVLQLPSDVKVRNVFAAGNFSVVTTVEDDVLGDPGVAAIPHRCLDDRIDVWSSECDTKTWRKTQKEICSMFSSASCLNGSFLEQSGEKHFRTSEKFHGLNLSAARQAFKKLVKVDRVRMEVEAAVLTALRSLDVSPPGVEGLRLYLLVLELLHVLQKNANLTEALASATLKLSEENLRVLGSWWSSLSRSKMLRHVAVWKQALSLVLSSMPVPRHTRVTDLLRVLQHMYNANSSADESHKLADSQFCLPMTQQFLQEELQLWFLRTQLQMEEMEPLILFKFPIVMDLQSKTYVFDLFTETTKLMEVLPVTPTSLWDCFHFAPMPDDVMFVLDLNREAVLEETFEQLAVSRNSDFKKRLGVVFDENMTFSPVYIKDFFYKVFHEAVSPQSEMFMFNDSQTLAWFSSKTPADPQRFFYFGVLCGLALYNQHIVFLPFPLVLFKRLLGIKPTLEDMMEFQPCLGRSLHSILFEYSHDVLESLCLDFTVNWDGMDVELDPKNPGKPMTSENKKEFVDAYMNYAFGASVARAFEAFQQGFFQVCEQQLVKLFRPEQLQQLLVGEDFNEWETLRQNTYYGNGYHDDHPVIQMFWDVFEELTESQKKGFLWFVTGFERVPVNADQIRMRIQPKRIPGSSDRFYPEAYTCSSTLELPPYSSKDVMKKKLIEALSNCERIYR